MKEPFSTEDMERITRAVREAEQKTSGEIVPYYVQSSDDYEEVMWRSGIFLGGLSMLILIGYFQFSNSWMFTLDLISSLFIVLASSAFGIVLALAVRPFKLMAAGKVLIDRRVSARALEAFVEQEVFNTRDRTGILIFLSLYEHRVQVIGDAGINAKVPAGAWHEVVDIVVSHMKMNKPADGLVKAIEKCGELLEAAGVARRADDTNELTDGLRKGN